MSKERSGAQTHSDRFFLPIEIKRVRERERVRDSKGKIEKEKESKRECVN